MISGADLSGGVAFDANSLNGLKNAAKENSPEDKIIVYVISLGSPYIIYVYYN